MTDGMKRTIGEKARICLCLLKMFCIGCFFSAWILLLFIGIIRGGFPVSQTGADVGDAMQWFGGGYDRVFAVWTALFAPVWGYVIWERLLLGSWTVKIYLFLALPPALWFCARHTRRHCWKTWLAALGAVFVLFGPVGMLFMAYVSQ